MDREAILGLIQELSYSQGFYGRLLRSIIECKENDPSSYEDFMEELEAQHFGSDLDVILYFEQ
jgi:hypothetical protein